MGLAPYGRFGLGTPNHHPHPQASKRLPFRQSLALACVQFATWGEARSLSDLYGIRLALGVLPLAAYRIRKRRVAECKPGVDSCYTELASSTDDTIAPTEPHWWVLSLFVGVFFLQPL